MDTLDLLEDLLADYEGTLILVSHDRDFIDRLATSTIGLDGSGRAVETRSGWQDFVSQNPGFLDLPAKPEPPARAGPPGRPETPQAHLQGPAPARGTGRGHDLPGKIAALEANLADPQLYTRDPSAFDGLSRELAAARDPLVSAEEVVGPRGSRETLRSGR
jgi:ATP-binding cassette subfamily F protein uup